MWCSLLLGETQCREMHDSAYWERLFGIVKSGRSTVLGKQRQIPAAVCHALEVENEQAEQREEIQLGNAECTFGKKTRPLCYD